MGCFYESLWLIVILFEMFLYLVSGLYTFFCVFFDFLKKKNIEKFGGCVNLQYFCIANENCSLLDV